ncbi:MAG TPA: hypothetical protein VK512_01020 [Xanthobacteraceae bacterium]|nr:hypothetical protein [Xanthobacteraceae bacterium]
MSKQKLTDDLRILVALRSGYAVAFHWHGSQQPRFSTDRIEHPDGRWRNVAHTAGRRLAQAGLITCEGWSRPCDYGDWSEPYRLTEAGGLAAVGLADIQDDKMFAAVKETPPEKLDRARHLRHSKKVIRTLAFHGCRIRGKKVRRVGWDDKLESVYYSGCRHDLPDAVMAILAPHLAPFVDVDGKESLRITEPGIAATASRGR